MRAVVVRLAGAALALVAAAGCGRGERGATGDGAGSGGGPPGDSEIHPQGDAGGVPPAPSARAGELGTGGTSTTRWRTGTKGALPPCKDPPVGSTSDWTGWKRVSPPCDFPLYAPLDVSIVPPLTWSACYEQPGCTRMDTPWYVGGIDEVLRSVAYSRSHAGEWLFLTQAHGTGRKISGVFALHQGGRAEGAFGQEGGGLAIGYGAIGEGRVAIEAAHPLADGRNVRSDFYVGALGDAATYAAPAFSGSTTTGYGVVQGLTLTEGSLGLEFAGYAVGVVDLATRELSIVSTPTLDWQAKTDPVAVGPHLLFRELDDTGFTLWVRQPGGTTERLRRGPPGVYVGTFASDGTTLAWIEATDRKTDFTFGHLELWVSPFATREADLAPRRVALVEDLEYPFAEMIVGDGQVAMLIHPDRPLRIYDTQAGTLRLGPVKPLREPCDFPPCPYSYPVRLLHLDREELIVFVTGVASDTVLRLALDTMPAEPLPP